ncbi:monovalent cation/H(+) antiporter subunit G [Georgenia sp. Z1344]|uniref:monovalent cation/H(+) antiporter subunit G n=1 Tax=Georgenia sp. Z1344 TaxID=3416706 RepID=UPI003CECD8D4
MSWSDVVSVLAAILLVAGSLLVLVAALALVRFPDLFSRMHAAAKPQVLGLALLMAGVALEVRDPRIGWTLVLVVAFQLLTAPISAHMAGRAGYRTGRVDRSRLVVDELAEDIEAAGGDMNHQHTGA